METDGERCRPLSTFVDLCRPTTFSKHLQRPLSNLHHSTAQDTIACSIGGNVFTAATATATATDTVTTDTTVNAANAATDATTVNAILCLAVKYPRYLPSGSYSRTQTSLGAHIEGY